MLATCLLLFAGRLVTPGAEEPAARRKGYVVVPETGSTSAVALQRHVAGEALERVDRHSPRPERLIEPSGWQVPRHRVVPPPLRRKGPEPVRQRAAGDKDLAVGLQTEYGRLAEVEFRELREDLAAITERCIEVAARRVADEREELGPSVDFVTRTGGVGGNQDPAIGLDGHAAQFVADLPDRRRHDAAAVEPGIEATVRSDPDQDQLEVVVGSPFPLDASEHEATVRLQADGKIVVVGSTEGYPADIALLRLDPDGRRDRSFGKGGRVITPWRDGAMASSMVIQNDGKILVAASRIVLRFEADGRLDSSFGDAGIMPVTFARHVTLQPDGKVLLGDGMSRLARFLPDWRPDPTFGHSGIATVPVGGNFRFARPTVQPDGKILLGGRRVVAGQPHFAAARCNADGTLDLTFGAAE